MTASAPTPAELDRPVMARSTFRLPFLALIFPLLLLFCTVPLASYRPWFAPLYLIPVAALAYVLITSTTVTSAGITARTLLTRRRVSWSELDGFEFRGPRWAIAVTHSGRRFRLPMIRPRDLPAVAAVSGGRLNLTPPTAQPASPNPIDETDVAGDTAAESGSTATNAVVDTTADASGGNPANAPVGGAVEAPVEPSIDGPPDGPADGPADPTAEADDTEIDVIDKDEPTYGELRG